MLVASAPTPRVHARAGYPVYDAYYVVNTTRNAMLVTMNYRVSTLGWLAGDVLRAASPDGSSGNWGLQDQRASLQFLIDTGTAFGGNPGRITIYGESAGGGSVSHFLTNKRAFGCARARC